MGEQPQALRAPRHLAPVLRLAPAPANRELVDTLTRLLEQAQRGELVGMAFAAMLKRRGYIVDTVGEASDSATYSRGMLRALDDKLAMRVRG